MTEMDFAWQRLPFSLRVTATELICGFVGVGATAVHTKNFCSRSSGLIQVTHRDLLSSVASRAQCGLLMLQFNRTPCSYASTSFLLTCPNLRATDVLTTAKSDDMFPRYKFSLWHKKKRKKKTKNSADHEASVSLKQWRRVQRTQGGYSVDSTATGIPHRGVLWCLLTEPVLGSSCSQFCKHYIHVHVSVCAKLREPSSSKSLLWKGH